MDEHM
jgi:hypothetical protein